MVYRTLTPAIVQSVLAHWQRKRALHWIARATHVDRKTVRRYVQAATAFVIARTGGTVQRDAVDLRELVAHVLALKADSIARRRAKQTTLHEHREVIANTLRDCATLRDAHKILRARGLDVSYPTLRRFVVLELGGDAQLRARTRNRRSAG